MALNTLLCLSEPSLGDCHDMLMYKEELETTCLCALVGHVTSLVNVVAVL